MAEYAAVYGGPPAPETPWPLFLTLVARTPMFQARGELLHFDAVRGAIGASFSDDQRAIDRERDQLVERAFPYAGPRRIQWVENLAGGTD